MIDDISVGDTVLVDNGNIHMKVLAKKGNRIRCEVLTAGTMSEGANLTPPTVCAGCDLGGSSYGEGSERWPPAHVRPLIVAAAPKTTPRAVPYPGTAPRW